MCYNSVAVRFVIVCWLRCSNAAVVVKCCCAVSALSPHHCVVVVVVVVAHYCIYIITVVVGHYCRYVAVVVAVICVNISLLKDTDTLRLTHDFNMPHVLCESRENLINNYFNDCGNWCVIIKTDLCRRFLKTARVQLTATDT